MAILVCGGAGYVGSHTAAELLERNYEVIVLDNLEKGHKKAVLPDAKLYVGDIRDSACTDRIFTENDITCVIDFAAYSLVGESVADPMKYYENNVYGTLCLLKAMLSHGVKQIVFSSTAATYGEPESVPITEDQPTNPKNPYGETKLAVEKIFKWYDGAYGLRSIALRYFNVAGAHRSGQIGEDHQPETHLIPVVLKAALAEDPCVTLFGDDYDTPDGSCVRDYIHATDLADAHILALEKLADGGGSDIFNLGNGQGFSNRDIVQTASRVTGKNIKINMGSRRPGDPATLVASSERIKKELGWQPKLGELEQIIGSAWKWHKTNPNGYGDR